MKSPGFERAFNKAVGQHCCGHTEEALASIDSLLRAAENDYQRQVCINEQKNLRIHLAESLIDARMQGKILPTKTADELFNGAFSKLRDARSPEYKQGVLAALKFRLEGINISEPFPEGSAALDAFYSGLDEGHRIWRVRNS
jgi:hypothetical protein